MLSKRILFMLSTFGILVAVQAQADAKQLIWDSGKGFEPASSACKPGKTASIPIQVVRQSSKSPGSLTGNSKNLITDRALVRVSGKTVRLIGQSENGNKITGDFASMGDSGTGIKAPSSSP